jgi:hypothetical protein
VSRVSPSRATSRRVSWRARPGPSWTGRAGRAAVRSGRARPGPGGGTAGALALGHGRALLAQGGPGGCGQVRDRLLAGGGLLGFLHVALGCLGLLSRRHGFILGRELPSGHAYPARPSANRRLSVYVAGRPSAGLLGANLTWKLMAQSVVARAEQGKHVGLDLQLGGVGPDIHVDMPRVRLSDRARAAGGSGQRSAGAPVPARSRLLIPFK